MNNSAQNKSYSLTDIDLYLNGKMNAKQRNLLEKAALQDAFLADALEGFSEADLSKANQHLQQIEDLILSASDNKKLASIIPISKPNNKFIWLSIAALFILIVSIYLVLNSEEKVKNIAQITTPSTTNKIEQSKVILPENEKKNEIDIAKKLQNKTVEPSINLDKQANATAQNKKTISIQPIFKQEEIIASSKDDKIELAEKDQEKEKITVAKIEEKKAEAQSFINQQQNIFVPQNKNLSSNQNNWSQKNISGRVLNQNQEPLAYVNLNIPKTNFNFNTDANGNFSIPLDVLKDTSIPVLFNSIGYIKSTSLLNTNNNNTVILEAANQNLNEVVITSLGTAKMKKQLTTNVFTSADSSLVPVNGWDAFNEYLSKNKYRSSYVDTTLNDSKTTATLKPLQEITLSFKVDTEGKPIDISIEKTATVEKNNIAVELLKNGPKWIGKDKKAKGKVSIKL